MPRINANLAQDQLNQCIGTNDPDASKGILYQATTRIALNPNQRTLIIGLGGNGIQTVNRIKSIITTKFTDYQERVAFLAIDTDENTLKQQAFLTVTEKHHIGYTGDIKHRYNDPQGRSDFTKSWLNPGFFNERLDGNGAGRDRQSARARIFDEGQSSSTCDQQILSKIKSAILGEWVMVNEEGKNCGIMLTFYEDGTFTYAPDIDVDIDGAMAAAALRSDVFADVVSELGTSSSDIGGVLETLGSVVTMNYEIKGNREIIVKTSFLYGLISNTKTVPYSLSGDDLTFDGIEYHKKDRID